MLSTTQAVHSPETLSAFLEGAAARNPDAEAFHEEGRALSWREFPALTRRVATGLFRHGLRPGDRVALWMPTLLDYLVLAFATWRCGAVVVSVNTRFQSSELEHVLGGERPAMLAFSPGFSDMDVSAVLARVSPGALASIHTILLQGGGLEPSFVQPDHMETRIVPLDALKDAPEMAEDAATPDSPAVTFTTSGTTRAPKFVLHRHRGVTHHSRDVAAALGFDAPDAVTLQATPLCAVYGFNQSLATIAGGRPQILMARFDGVEAAALVRRHRVTHLMGTDDMFHRMLQSVPERHAFPSLRACGYVLFNPALKGFLEEAEQRGLPLIGLYGMSEVQALFAGQRPDAPAALRHRDGGFPFSPLAGVRVRDEETGALLPHERTGLLELRGPSLMAGYLEDEAATRAAFTEDGWLRTGDLAYTLPDGSFRYVARAGDALRLGGFLTSPAEIEAHIERHPAVAGVQVVGATSATRPCAVAFVLLHPGAAFDEAAMRSWCAEGLARYKVPARIVPLEEFPVTRSGNGTKIQRAALRRMAQALFEGDVPAG
ncbi:MAG TPA: AMP-binding protein [Acetobacteraceae bacterium]|nr:AMP-binding protein [Acetobacteraceae bacterium]